MARRPQQAMEWDDEDWADDDIEEEDDATIPCPYCRRAIHEDSVRCPYCEQYISEEDAPPGKRPWWIVVGVVLCLAAIGLWFVVAN